MTVGFSKKEMLSLSSDFSFEISDHKAHSIIQ